MFDLSIPKLLVLAVIALVVFGPKELPKIASQAGRALRDLRKIAEGAKNDLREGLGPEFADLDIEDLNPAAAVSDATPSPAPCSTASAASSGGTTRSGRKTSSTASAS